MMELGRVVEIDKIQQLVRMMVSHDLLEITLRDGEEEISIRRPNYATSPADLLIQPPLVPNRTTAPLPAVVSTAALASSESPLDDVGLVKITSPMVGTFYSAADPDSPPFVQVGSTVSSGMVVCILEAMKVFNEIKSEVAGTIERILTKNAQPVEYGQPLFLVRPA